eukprot:TRINITY_DN14534_c0_g1_i1.p1 TRINITY_DN14534_c0_g1~~TRINITY_DN14534_c0_g1_i1.p1  ORF type:complete len:638 (-),score=108.52 TRINITY_DN14534_c0_g1_i1:142-1902(-)
MTASLGPAAIIRGVCNQLADVAQDCDSMQVEMHSLTLENLKLKSTIRSMERPLSIADVLVNIDASIAPNDAKRNMRVDEPAVGADCAAGSGLDFAVRKPTTDQPACANGALGLVETPEMPPANSPVYPSTFQAAPEWKCSNEGADDVDPVVNTTSAQAVSIDGEELTSRETTATVATGMFVAPAQILLSDTVSLYQSRPEFVPVSPLQGLMHRIFQSGNLDGIMSFIIFLNSVTIGVEVSLAKAGLPAPAFIFVIEQCFIALYSLELFARIYVYRMAAIKNKWVQFDAFLVVGGVLELMTKLYLGGGDTMMNDVLIIRLMRLARVTRVVRFIRHFPTLWLLVQGLVNSCGTLVWTFVVMGLLLYIFAIAGLELIQPNGSLAYQSSHNAYFGSLGKAMLSLWQVLTFDDSSGIYRPLIEENMFLALYFTSFMLLGSIALMNLVTATMVEFCSKQASEDQKSKEARESARRKAYMPKLREMFLKLDGDHNGMLELREILDAPAWVKEELNAFVDVSQMADVFRVLDSDCMGELDIDQFCDGLFKAITVNKPIELTRIMQQCSEICTNTNDILRHIGLHHDAKRCRTTK